MCDYSDASEEDIKIDKYNFGLACTLSDYVILKHIVDDKAIIETNRLSRRELVRYGIPFKYVKGN